jgi:SAM-dependent methyltransferase
MRHPSARDLVNRTIKAHFGTRSIRVLEAGGGSRSRLLEAGITAISGVTTIDIDKDQLDRNNYAETRILADLQDHRFDSQFDLIEVMNVVEHIEDLEKALDNISDASAEDGLIVLAFPYIHSLSGFVTRYTPHWFHVFFRRRILREPHAGEPGYGPFVAHYNPLIAPAKMKAYFEARGFRTELLLFYPSRIVNRVRRNYFLLYIPLAIVTAVVNFCTPKAYDTRNGECFLIVHRCRTTTP